MNERLRAWAYRRQCLDRSAPQALAALEAVLAVHSTHPPAPLSLLARTSSLPYAEFEKLEQEKVAISLPIVRGSVHLLPTQFGPPMLAATSPRNIQLLKRLGVEEVEFDSMRDKLLPMLDVPVSGSTIRKSLGITDMEFLAIRLLTRTGDVLRLSTNPRADRLQYVATAAWLGGPLERIDADEARAWLANAYFSSFGPARLQDFAWWSGLTQKESRAAMADLPLVDVGEGLLLPEADAPAFHRTERLNPAAIAIVPKWDSYTMGYAPDGRRRFINDEHLDQAYTTKETRVGATTGDGLPLILRGGRAIARWEHRFSKMSMSVNVVPFTGEAVRKDEILSRFEEVGGMMGCTVVHLEIASS